VAPVERHAVKPRKAGKALAGVALCALGLGFALPSPYNEKVFLIDAHGCRLETSIVEESGGGIQGSVVLLHGLAANKKIMSYLARGFAEQGLRVYVPDLPGHGRTPGPFSPARAEQCSEALLGELLARGRITPNRTILAGHSMGGAIAARVVSRIPLAGVIAISPAPMRVAHGVLPELLLFHDPPPPPNSLVISGGLEPESMRSNAADFATARRDGTTKYVEIPWTTHVGLLFNSATVRISQQWAAHILHLTSASSLPSHRPLIGSLLGFAGLLLIAGPFLHEATEKKTDIEIRKSHPAAGLARLFGEFAAGSMIIVVLLRFWNPLKIICLFEGDYLVSFLLLLGAALVFLHRGSLGPALGGRPIEMLGVMFGGLVLFLLIAAWSDLTFYQAWLTAEKWARFPFLLVVLLPYHTAEEIVLGSTENRTGWRRLALGLSLRLITWAALMAGVLVLHSGEVLLGLLAPYLAIFNLLQRCGMDLVRNDTDSAAASALFGAILLAGFCAVIFPVT
jgi:pimeloyl-ACP methyl ester carboxylesterase